jgi:hypothetical protein
MAWGRAPLTKTVDGAVNGSAAVEARQVNVLATGSVDQVGVLAASQVLLSEGLPIHRPSTSGSHDDIQAKKRNSTTLVQSIRKRFIEQQVNRVHVHQAYMKSRPVPSRKKPSASLPVKCPPTRRRRVAMKHSVTGGDAAPSKKRFKLGKPRASFVAASALGRQLRRDRAASPVPPAAVARSAARGSPLSLPWPATSAWTAI